MVKPWPGVPPDIDPLQHPGLLPEVDWQRPCYLPWERWGKPVLSHWRAGCSLPDALNQEKSSEQTVQFVPQHVLPKGVAYENHVFETGEIPTRALAHDFFNGLCWLRFPQTKTQLNRLQAQEIARQGVGAQRGHVRDAITLFDENAALWCAPDLLWQALIEKDWHGLFVTHRSQWVNTHLVLFGHALLEKLLHPFKGITAHVFSTPMPRLTSDQALDAWLCQQLQAESLAKKPFVPLPLAGVPGWWPNNHVPDFYEDKKVFRD